MKIGIISINAHTKVLNFASPLHSYAFQQFLTKKGYDNVIIDYKPVYYGGMDVRHPYDHYLKHPDKNPEKQEKLLAKWKYWYKEREGRFDKIQAFIDKYYVTTDKCYDHKLLDTEDPGCDIYICATDVIWKYNPKNGFDRGFFLDCKTMKGKGKIAYAASRGASTYNNDKKKKKFDTLVSDFDFVSTREKSLYEYINENTYAHANLVLDPVFLHDEDFYEPLYRKPEEEGYVLVYTVMNETPELVEEAYRFAQAKGLKLIELSEDYQNAHIPEGTEHPVIYDLGVEEWLGYMKYADYIFTNSFHCCCFSIIMHKEFFAGPRPGDKVDWVIEMFGLTDRRIKPGEEFAVQSIDFERIDAIRKKYQKASEHYIVKAIEKTKTRLKHPKLRKLSRRIGRGMKRRLNIEVRRGTDGIEKLI